MTWGFSLRVLSNTPKVTFQEVPEEVSLVYSVCGCGGPCEGCHSPELHEGGVEFDLAQFYGLLDEMRELATCVCFLGGDLGGVLLPLQKASALGYKTAWYSQADSLDEVRQSDIDYVKVGRYDKSRGGLQTPGTNQKLYKRLEGGGWQLLDLIKHS